MPVKWTEFRSPEAACLSDIPSLLPYFLKKGELLQEGNTRRIYLVHLSDEPLVLKHWFPKPFPTRLRPLTGPSPAEKEWKSTCAAASRGLTTLTPLVLLERRLMGVIIESHMLFRMLPTRLTLSQALLEGSISVDKRSTLIMAFGEALAAIHSQNIAHGDFNPGNAVVETRGEESELIVIDWSDSKEIDPNDQASRLAELAATIRSLIHSQLSDREIDLFFEGYAKKASWFRNAGNDHREELLLLVWRRIYKGIYRVMRNCTRRSRRLKVARRSFRKCFLFRNESVRGAFAAVQGSSELYAVEESRALETWQAINVLVSMGHGPSGIAGLVVEKLPLTKSRYFLLFNPRLQTAPFDAIISNARAIVDKASAKGKL